MQMQGDFLRMQISTAKKAKPKDSVSTCCRLVCTADVLIAFILTLI
jgi:hypothetical protein